MPFLEKLPKVIRALLRPVITGSPFQSRSLHTTAPSLKAHDTAKGSQGVKEPSEHEKWLQHRAQSHWKPNMDMTVAEIRAECFFTRSWGSDYTAEFVDLFRPKSRRRFPRYPDPL